MEAEIASGSENHGFPYWTEDRRRITVWRVDLVAAFQEIDGCSVTELLSTVIDAAVMVPDEFFETARFVFDDGWGEDGGGGGGDLLGGCGDGRGAPGAAEGGE